MLHHTNALSLPLHCLALFPLLQSVEIPALKVTKKVRSMQMYRAPVHKAAQGDRVGICVTQFDSKLLERGLVCSPGHLPTIYGNCGGGVGMGWAGEGTIAGQICRISLAFLFWCCSMGDI